MNTLIINIGISFLLGMFLSALLHIYFYKKTSLNEIFMSSISAITLASTVGITAVSYFFWSGDDFVADMSLKKYLIPLIGSLIVLFASFSLNLLTTIVFALIVSIFSIYYTGIIINFADNFPEWLNIILTITLLWAFACSFYCISGISPFPPAQGLSIAIGFVILTMLNAAPAVTGYSAALLSGVLFIAYARCGYQPINRISAITLGYIIGWFGLMAYQEYLLSCFVTFSMCGLIECLVAIYRKIISFPKIQNTPENTSLFRVLKESDSPQIVTRFIWSTNTLLVILGIFQINGPNEFSLPVFAIILCLWQQYRLLNWQQPELSLKEAGKETLTSLKKSFNTFFKNSDDNKPTDDK